MKEGNEWKTTFITKQGIYKWLIIPFGLTNASNTFMRLMNQVIRAKNLSDHLMHFKQVLKTLRKEKIYGNHKKCTFCTNHLVFLGCVVSSHGLHVDEEKIKAIPEWPTPTNIGHVRSFHGLASFYMRFFKDLGTITAALTYVIKKNVAFKWGEAQEAAFKTLKDSLTKSPILT